MLACEAPVQGPPAVGEPLADFSSTTLTEDSVSVHGLRGQPVLMNMWATWCVPCRVEIPFLQSVWEQYREEDLAVIGVSVDAAGARAQVEDFVREAGVTYPILLDPEGRSMDLYLVIGLPVTYLLDRDGVVRFLRQGPVQEDDPDFWSGLEEVIR